MLRHTDPYIPSMILGLAVGDALGVPVEFQRREQLQQDPVADMRGYGTYPVPPGTWSDDTALSLCLAEALTEGFDLRRIADKFVAWLYDSYWTATGEVFDVGMTTRNAIYRLKMGNDPQFAGDWDINANGNGSLMRILPLLPHIRFMPADERYDCVKKISSMTHGHVRSAISCFYYLEFARLLLDGHDLKTAYQLVRTPVNEQLLKRKVVASEIAHFDRLLIEDIHCLPLDKINSDGYVLHTLEASIWCLLNTSSYTDAVLMAVNLGGDTDTTATVTGGLAGLYYGMGTIPAGWLNLLQRKNEILSLANRLENVYSRRNPENFDL